MDLEELLERVKTKDDPASGIGLASTYLKMIFDCTDGICGVMPQDVAPIADWQKAIGDADKVLVYTPEEMEITVKDESDKKFIPTPKACMDFETVMTSARKDRDGDILDTKGAEPDLSMPYLFMHTHFHIGGKLVQITLHNSKLMKGHFALLDCQVGNDMAFLIENKALRSSIGFLPIEYEPIKDSKNEEKASYRNGYRFKRFKIMETSGVPVPANEDAIITAYSRAKLFSPMAKLLGYSLKSKLPPQVTSGFDKDGEPETKEPCGCHKSPLTPEQRMKLEDVIVGLKGDGNHSIVVDGWIAKIEQLSKSTKEIDFKTKEPTIDELATKLIGRLLKGEHPNPILVTNLQETLAQEEQYGTDRVLAELLG